MKKLISRKRKYSFKKKMQSFKQALAQEKQETLEMLSIYKKFTKRAANKAEMKIAHAQFFDLLKGCGLGVFALLPLAPITIPILLKVGRMIGVDLLPTSFNGKKSDQDK